MGWTAGVDASRARSPSGLLTHEFLERPQGPTSLRSPVSHGSLVYFLVAAATPDVRLQSGKMLFTGVKIGTTRTGPSASSSRPERSRERSDRVYRGTGVAHPAERDSALKDIERAPALCSHSAARGRGSGGFKRGILTTMPRMLFRVATDICRNRRALLPGPEVPRTPLLRIHLTPSPSCTCPGRGIEIHGAPIRWPRELIGVIWVPIYAVLAFRRGTGGSYVRTGREDCGIGVLYACATAVASWSDSTGCQSRLRALAAANACRFCPPPFVVIVEGTNPTGESDKCTPFRMVSRSSNLAAAIAVAGADPRSPLTHRHSRVPESPRVTRPREGTLRLT